MKEEEIKKEYEKILNQLSDPELISDMEKFEELSKRKKKLEEIIEKEKEIEETKNKIQESKDILAAGEDPELDNLAQTELAQLKEKENNLNKELEKILKADRSGPKYDSVIIEIRAGTGGNEAALFAGDLFRMYSKYADSQKWTKKILDSNPAEIGGFKQVIFEIKGDDTFSKIKYEGGVHRVQRIPNTEKSGRVHTSTASVAIMPKPKTTQLKIKSDELRVDCFRASGPGGQYVNKRETAVRITHIPTGIMVASQAERNQLQNKESAMSILRAKLLEKKHQEEESKAGATRKAQIGRAKRVEKIRTYNFPQDRVTDHRIKKSWHNIEKILNGELDKMIETLEKTI